MKTENGSFVEIKAKTKLIYSSFYKAEKVVADYILELQEPINVSVVVLANQLGLSEATILRFCRKIGLSGFSDLKLALAQQLTARNAERDDLIPDIPIEECDTIDMIPKKMICGVRHALSDLENTISIEMLSKAIERLKKARHVLLFGVAHSAAVCEDLACRLMKLGIPSTAVSDSHMQAISAQNAMKEDVVVAISHSGVTIDVVDAARLAKEHGATIICISNCLDTPLTRVSDIQLLTGGHEVTFNSETITSRISQLVIIDMLYTGIVLSDYQRYTDHLARINETMQKKAY